MSKFGPLWEKPRKEDLGGYPPALGPPALDDTSDLGSEALSRLSMSPSEVRAYYGGFYPTEEWLASLEPVTRSQRVNPQFTDQVETLDDAHRRSLAEKAAPYLALAPADLIGMVPLRNRIAGNARVMPSTRIAKCPSGDGETLTWRPDDPDMIWCPNGHAVNPFTLFPQTGSIEITGPLGDHQSYPYHEDADGKRTYLNGEYMDSLRVYYLIEASEMLGLLYQDSGDISCAERAAAILFDFACAVPHWPKTHRGRPGIAEEDRLRPVNEYPVYAGIWYDKYHSGIRHACGLAECYDLVVNAPVWESLDQRTEEGDARALIEGGLFLYTVVDAIRYDIVYPHPDSALSNYIPYQANGLIRIGRSAGLPELVHYACWKLRQMVGKTLMADHVFPESMSYARQHVYGIKHAASSAEGYSDPPGFVSSIDGQRYDDFDSDLELPGLRRAVDTLDTMGYPDGNYMMVHDTYSLVRGGGHTEPQDGRSLIYPSFGHAVLGRGAERTGDRLQAHLHYSGSWGHDHHDMLNLVLWAYEDELISDIGYTWTYRMYATFALGHNLVVVDRETQKRTPTSGCLRAWHPCADGVQVVEASGPEAYPQCHAYGRTLFLIPVGDSDNLVLDVFEVAGGRTHEWMAHGSCSTHQTLNVSVPVAYHSESYADDGKPFVSPNHSDWEMELHQQGLRPMEVNPWYGVFRDVHKGKPEGTFTGVFEAADGDMPDVRVHLLEHGGGDLYTCTVPTIRQCWSPALGDEDHSLVERHRMPKLVVRRDGEDLRSRFVALWEPIRGSDVVAGTEDLAPGHPEVVVREIRTTPESGGERIRVFYSSDSSRRQEVGEGMAFQGRYAVTVAGAEGRQATLYDCSTFQDEGLEVTVAPRASLPVLGVQETDEAGHAVVLDGTWPDIVEGQPLVFPEPEMVILAQDGARQRAFPVDSVMTSGGRTVLSCSRHPGFEYDPESGVLKDVFTPFQSSTGEAEISLPSRVYLKTDGDGPGTWLVRTTDAVAIGGNRVGRTEAWVPVPS